MQQIVTFPVSTGILLGGSKSELYGIRDKFLIAALIMSKRVINGLGSGTTRQKKRGGFHAVPG